MQRIYDAILALIAVALFLLIAAEMQDREEHFEEIRKREIETQIEKAVAIITEGHP